MSHLLTYWRRTLEDLLQRQSGAALLLATLFVIGVIFGALAVRSIDPRDRLELVGYLGGNLQRLLDPPGGAGGLLFRRQLLGKLKLLALFWALGISVVGVVGVMVITLLRGLLSGFFVSFVVAELGARGILLAALGHLPQSLLEVPALLLAGTASVAFSLQVVRSWRDGRRVRNFYPVLGRYTAALVVTAMLLVGACLVESFLSPALLALATNLAKSL